MISTFWTLDYMNHLYSEIWVQRKPSTVRNLDVVEVLSPTFTQILSVNAILVREEQRGIWDVILSQRQHKANNRIGTGGMVVTGQMESVRCTVASNRAGSKKR